MEKVGNPEISIHAILGTPTPNTMRIVGTIQQQRVVILVNSGNTHNVLDPKKAKIFRIFKQVIKVKIANAEVLAREGKCIDVP